MLDKILWNLFLNTGDLRTYLSYKDMEKDKRDCYNKENQNPAKQVFSG